jgi:hypothetical protein
MKHWSRIKHANEEEVKISPKVEFLIFVDEVLSERISKATYDAIGEHSGGKGVFLKKFLIG